MPPKARFRNSHDYPPGDRSDDFAQASDPRRILARKDVPIRSQHHYPFDGKKKSVRDD